MKRRHIYQTCPVYESDHFRLRLVELRDAEDLLHCYSDVQAVARMNADNCTSDFYYRRPDEMKDCILGWLDGYKRGIVVRFCILDVQTGAGIGTIEMYAKTKDIGVLRLDLRSAYEQRDAIVELLELSVGHFCEEFGVHQVLVKAISAATERISALRACGFAAVEHHAMLPYGDYYMR